MALVRETNGFEAVHAYRDDEDHIFGGKDNTFWYVILRKGKTAESLIGILHEGHWQDTLITGSGARRKTKQMPEGSAIARIAARAYLFQEESWVQGRKPKLAEEQHPHLHYVYGFGDKALDISQQYGITIAWSDIRDVPAGFRLRSLSTGNEVETPE